MKFTLALIATASAVKIEAAGVCVSMAQSDHVFEMVDVNDDGQISEKELRSAVTQYLDAHDIHPTKAQIKAFATAAGNEAGKDQTLSKPEFNALANDVAHHIAPDHCSA